ncbi:zinc finger protein 91 [Orussus abietinus]|uniref:zinc finger protein 91 n=1 Tax=Orussus abietinus TaxID=222816 RepID=UPI0006257204|nr:zinc finger protein 91 [Orussus abietinus]
MDAEEINTSEEPRNEEAIVSAVEICRVCLMGNLVMRSLFHETEVVPLSAKAMSFASVKMLPGDGLPAQVCCTCAEKLESAYEFKLQVEQADSVLRERFDNVNIKEELFFNEVEVHLEADRTDEGEEMHVEISYQDDSDTICHSSHNSQSTLLKDHLALLQVEKLAEQERVLHHEENLMQSNGEHIEERLEDPEQGFSSEEVQEGQSITISRSQENIKAESFHDMEAITIDEHNYVVQQGYTISNDKEFSSQPTDSSNQEISQFESRLEVEESVTRSDNDLEETPSNLETQIPVEQDASQVETRRSKRKLTRRATINRDSDEENYFENLNLSSRLKKAQADKGEKVFFVCYLCDKQFLSKGVLKEHMHSHEEVRRALSLKKVPEKPQKVAPVSTKMPPSGKRANKCPYCGKEYLYIISFSKHLKQHEKEKDRTKEEPMPLEVSFQEDNNTIDYPGYNNKQHSDVECPRVERSEEADTKGSNDDDQENEKRKRRKSRNAEQYSCTECSEKFKTKRGLCKHTIQHTPLKCTVCEEEFDALEKLRNHRTKHVMEGVLLEQDLEDIKNVVGKEAEEEELEQEEEAGVDDGEGDEPYMESSQEDYVHANDGSSEEKDLKCPNCPMMYSHKKSLSRHLETHVGTKYGCKLCCQQFSRKDHLRRHAEQHGRLKSYKCTQCNKTFGNELTLRNHLIATNHRTIIHGQEYDPNKRIKRVAAKAAQKIIDKIKTEDGLEDEDEDDNHDDYEGDYQDFDRQRYMGRGALKKQINRKELECATCNKKCSSKQSLTKHMEQHVKEEATEKVEKLEKAKKLLERKDVQRGNLGMGMDVGIGADTGDVDDDDDDHSDFESGLDWPMDNHECTTCKKRYSTKKSLLRHQLLHEEPNFECDICNVKFYRKDKLKAHYDKCSEKNPDQVRKCNICGDSFENNEILREHRAKHVTEGILTEEDLREIEPRPEERKQGEKVARKRRTDIVGLECTECNKRYTSRKGLLRHIQVHEGKKYLCDICPKKFYRREHLKIHVAKHNMIKPYKCNRCTKRFIKEEQLTNHLSKHDRTFKKNKETDSSKRFLCEICSKSFTQSTTLIAHLRAHKGIKPYVCEVCSRPFTTNAYLKMHMRTHTQERPYICQYCSRAFARADTLANHLTSHTGEAKYHCKYCPKNFRRLKSLKEHVFIHTGQRPYACPTCDRRFNNNGSRYAHSKRCKQNLLQNQTRAQNMNPPQTQIQGRIHQTITQAQVIKSQNIKTITITRPTDQLTQQGIMQHQEILMPLILPLTVTLTDVGEEVILPEGTKIFTTS